MSESCTPTRPLPTNQRTEPSVQSGSNIEYHPLQKRQVKKRTTGTTVTTSDLEVSLASHTTQDQPESDSKEKIIEKYNHIPFDGLKRISFFVDGAVGLPSNCTVTRVTGRLIYPDRRDVASVGSVESFSDPESPCFSPSYNLFLSWRAAALDPSLTILCRIDTLERTRLQPQTVGYSALKLCVLKNLQQPASGDDGGPSFLNAGCFHLPIRLGAIPTWCPVTQKSIGDLPAMPNAFLIVRLFDSSAETPSRQDPPHPLHSSPGCPGTGRQKSRVHTAAEVLYATYDNPVAARAVANRGVPPLPLAAATGKRIAMGLQADVNEMQVLRAQLTRWLHSAFPPPRDMRSTLEIRFATRYAEPNESGSNGSEILVCADMLYNMPPVSSRRGGAVLYKTCFSYLRGKRSPFPQGEQFENPKFIVDDVSRFVDFDASSEMCPVYVDEFTSLSHMDLGPLACLLVLVSRVDVTYNKDSSFDLNMPLRHPERSWWGILPLRVESPFYAPEGSAVAESEFDGAYVNSGTHQVPLFRGLCPMEVVSSPNPYRTVLKMLRQNQPVQSAGCFCMGSMYMSVGVAPGLVDEFEQPVLSESGASAIVRVTDARMVSFAHNHVKVDLQSLDTSCLNEMLLAEAGSSRAKLRQFEYEACKYEMTQSLTKTLLHGQRNGSKQEELMRAVNLQMWTNLQEYLDSLS